MSLTTDNLINISFNSVTIALAVVPCIVAFIQLYHRLIRRRQQRQRETQQWHPQWHGSTGVTGFSSSTPKSRSNDSTETINVEDDDIEAQKAESGMERTTVYLKLISGDLPGRPEPVLQEMPDMCTQRDTYMRSAGPEVTEQRRWFIPPDFREAVSWPYHPCLG